jgi:hypothetical protein
LAVHGDFIFTPQVRVMFTVGLYSQQYYE